MNPHVSCPFCLRLRTSVFVETKRRQSTLKEKKKNSMWLFTLRLMLFHIPKRCADKRRLILWWFSCQSQKYKHNFPFL